MTKDEINAIAQTSPPAAAALVMAQKYEARIAELEKALSAMFNYYRLQSQPKEARDVLSLARGVLGL